MFESRITGLHQIDNQVQFVTIEISNLGWRILESGNLTKAQLQSRVSTVSHFLHSWRTELALSLRQDNVLYKSVLRPEEADTWWVEQQVEEVLNVRSRGNRLACDYFLTKEQLSLFLCENSDLKALQKFIKLDVLGWQITDLISLCYEYNQHVQSGVDGYISADHRLVVSFTQGIQILKVDKQRNSLPEIERFMADQDIKQVLNLGSELEHLSCPQITVSQAWQVLGVTVEEAYYPSLATALGAMHWKRGMHRD